MGSPRNTDWVFTINNYNGEDLQTLEQLKNLETTIFLAYQEEIAESGTPHIQGFVQFAERVRRGVANTRLGGHAAVYVRRGTPEQAAAYANKEDTRKPGCEPIRWGRLNVDRRNRSDDSRRARNAELTTIFGKISENTPPDVLLREHGELYLRYSSVLYRLSALAAHKRDFETRITIVYGPTGTGKSKWAVDNTESAYWKPRGHWWDGYAAHESVIIDDFYGWIPYDQMLRIGDRYPLLVEIKGGVANFVAKEVIITSNRPPDQWWRNIHDNSAFIRRIKKFVYIPDRRTILETEDYAQFCNMITPVVLFGHQATF